MNASAPSTRREGRAAAFIDRDGVINEDLGHVGRVEDFRLLPRAIEGLSRLAACGYALVVVTNQAGIAKGYYGEEDYRRVTAHLLAVLDEHGVRIEGVYHCPHHPDGTVPELAIVCDCRKPAPGLLLRAARELDLALERSILIGDKPSDTAAGRAARVRATVLVASGHRWPDDAARHADHLCADLADAASWVCALDRS